MSIFSSRTVKTLPIPFDVPHEVTIRKLAGRHLEAAHAAYVAELYHEVRDRGVSAVQKDFQKLFEKDAKEETEKQIAEVQADPLNGYDRYVVMAGGIQSWTYPESLTPERVKTIDAYGNEVTVMRIAALDDLSEEAIVFFATEIMRLTKPELFMNTEEAKAGQKETVADSSVA